MDAFGYLSVLLSIIVGFAISQILLGFRGIVLARARVRAYWPTVAWAVLLLLINVQSWWAMFGLRVITDWTFPAFSMLLLQAIAQYMLAAIVFPDFPADQPVDLREHYRLHARWFFGLLIMLLLVSMAKDRVIGGHLPSGVNLLVHLGFMAMSAVAMVVTAERYHKVFSLLGLAIFGAYIVALFTQLQ